MAASTVHPIARAVLSDGALEQWLNAFDAWRLPKPSTESLTVDGVTIPLVWREHRVAAVTEEISTDIIATLESMAFSVVHLPNNVPAEAPAQLAELLGDLV